MDLSCSESEGRWNDRARVDEELCSDGKVSCSGRLRDGVMAIEDASGETLASCEDKGDDVVA